MAEDRTALALNLALHLLADDEANSRRELLAAGVSPHRVQALYPASVSRLPSGLARYLDGGGRFCFFDAAFQPKVMGWDLELWESLNSSSKAAIHRDLDDLMAASSTRQVNRRISNSTTTKFGREAEKEGPTPMQVEADLAYLYTSIWYLLYSGQQGKAAEMLLKVTEYLMPDLEAVL